MGIVSGEGRKGNKKSEATKSFIFTTKVGDVGWFKKLYSYSFFFFSFCLSKFYTLLYVGVVWILHGVGLGVMENLGKVWCRRCPLYTYYFAMKIFISSTLESMRFARFIIPPIRATYHLKPRLLPFLLFSIRTMSTQKFFDTYLSCLMELSYIELTP